MSNEAERLIASLIEHVESLPDEFVDTALREELLADLLRALADELCISWEMVDRLNRASLSDRGPMQPRDALLVTTADALATILSAAGVAR